MWNLKEEEITSQKLEIGKPGNNPSESECFRPRELVIPGNPNRPMFQNHLN